MKNTVKDYFTPGELAKLTGISKQILLYYDKNNIFSPSFVDDNGYRYYSLSQYFSLEILITMRKLDIPLQDIMFYLKNKKSFMILKKIYTLKLHEYQDKIKQLQQYESALAKRLMRLEKIESIRLNQIMLSEQSEELYYRSADIPLSITPKKRILKIAEYMFPHLRSKLLEDCVIGFQLNKDEFIQCQKLSKYNIFIQTVDMNINKDTDILKKRKWSLPFLYIAIVITVLLMMISKLNIKNFININKLSICSDVFVFPIRNYWSATTNSEEISQICIQVEYMKDSVTIVVHCLLIQLFKKTLNSTFLFCYLEFSIFIDFIASKIISFF